MSDRKNQAIKMFQNLGKQIQDLTANPDSFVEALNNTPEIMYFEEIRKEIESFGFSSEVASKAANTVVVEANTFDADICRVYLENCFRPMLTAMIENHSRLNLYKFLSKEDILIDYCKDASFKYII